MIDPVTALTVATAAFNGAKKLVEAGRDIEDVAGQLGKWFTAAADITKHEEEVKNPSLFKKIANRASIEEEALNAMITKKKLKEQEDHLRELILWSYGQDAYVEMMQMRKEIRARREKEIYNKRKLKRQIIDGIIITFVIGIGLGITIWFVDLLLSKGG